MATSLELDAVSLFSATSLPGTELWEMAGASAIPDSVDFRTPQVNLTALPDDRYTDVFTEVAGRFDAYNRAQMETQVNWVD